MSSSVSCPRCGSTQISFQREQTASVGAHTNKVYVQPAKEKHGCFWWVFIGCWWVPTYWLLIGWWWKPLFGRGRRGGLGLHADKAINRTVAVCQNCGHSWKVK